MLDIEMRVVPVKQVESESLIGYGSDGSLAIVLRGQNNTMNRFAFCFDDFQTKPCLDESADEREDFRGVCDYGKDFTVSINSKCRIVNHASDAKLGCLLLKGVDQYIAMKNTGPDRKIRFFNLRTQRSQHSDEVGYNVGIIYDWSLCVPRRRIMSYGPAIELFRFKIADVDL